jgi:hypothetical protein
MPTPVTAGPIRSSKDLMNACSDSQTSRMCIPVVGEPADVELRAVGNLRVPPHLRSHLVLLIGRCLAPKHEHHRRHVLSIFRPSRSAV